MLYVARPERIEQPSALRPADARTARDLEPRGDLSNVVKQRLYVRRLEGEPARFARAILRRLVYFAHWHVVELALRLPRRAIDPKTLRRYRAGQSLDVRSVGSDLIITVSAEREDFDAADDGRGWLSSLTPPRADVATGEERVLYLAWLLGVQYGEIHDRATEPARPDGLATLSPALESFIDIMGLDRDLAAAAAKGSTPTSATPLPRVLKRWIAELEGGEKVDLLSRVALAEPGVGAELMGRFHRQAPPR